MLNYMRLFEVHLFETDSDLDLALQGGVINPQRVASTHCLECADPIGHSTPELGFIPFALVIDENDKVIVRHVANYADDPVFINHSELDSYWRKSHHLIEWVKKHKPNWKILTNRFMLLLVNNELTFVINEEK